MFYLLKKGALHFHQYPAITVCIYGDRSAYGEDIIKNINKFEEIDSLSNDIITRHIYHFKFSNG